MAYGEYTHKESTIKVPVVASKGWQRGSSWTAEVRHPDEYLTKVHGGGWRADGATEAEAKQRLTEVVRAGLARAEMHPVLVIGGGEGYETCIHLISADTHGIGVRISRDGRSAGSWWTGSGTVEDELANVLKHVGGTPQVVRL